MVFFSNNYNYDIIIVGGGISGLFIGYKLSELNQKILILESSSILGGRIKTEYKNDDVYFESGAARFHKKHSKLLSLINELDLQDNINELNSEIDYNILGSKDNVMVDIFNNLNEAIKKKIYQKKN